MLWYHKVETNFFVLAERALLSDVIQRSFAINEKREIMKKFFSFALVLCLMLGICAVPASAANKFPIAGVSADIDPGASGPPPLTFARKFSAVDRGEGYDDYIADFVITINKDATFDAADSNSDGYLAGYYELWCNAFFGNKWLKVPFAPVSVKANEPIRIMQTAGMYIRVSDLFPDATANGGVENFSCGIYFSDAFRAANPDLQITLELNLYADESPNAVPIPVTKPEKFSPTPNNPAPAPAPAAPTVQNIYYVPATADNSHMALWSVLALGLLSTAFVTRKKKAEN